MPEGSSAPAEDWRRQVERAYQLHRDAIFGCLCSMARPAAAEDALQEVFTRALKAGPSQRLPVEVQLGRAYLLVSARRMIWKERQRRPSRQSHPSESRQVVDGGGDPVHRRESRFDSEAIMCAIERLPSDLRATVQMIIADDVPVRAAARALNCPESRIWVWKHRAIERVRRALTKHTVGERLLESA